MDPGDARPEDLEIVQLVGDDLLSLVGEFLDPPADDGSGFLQADRPGEDLVAAGETPLGILPVHVLGHGIEDGGEGGLLFLERLQARMEQMDHLPDRHAQALQLPVESPGEDARGGRPARAHGRGIALDVPQGPQDDPPQDVVEADDQQQVEQQGLQGRVDRPLAQLPLHEPGGDDELHVPDGLAHGGDRAFLDQHAVREDVDRGGHGVPLPVPDPRVDHHVVRVDRIDLRDDHAVEVPVLHLAVEDLPHLVVVEVPERQREAHAQLVGVHPQLFLQALALGGTPLAVREPGPPHQQAGGHDRQEEHHAHGDGIAVCSGRLPVLSSTGKGRRLAFSCLGAHGIRSTGTWICYPEFGR